jgi:putative endonuclease
MATPGARALGQAAEERACRHLELQGLRIVERNVRWRLGEIDAVARDGATWVFVEIRSRARRGDAAASIDARKRGRIRRAAQLYLVRHFGDRWPACRFDVIVVEAGALQWLPSAFAMNEEG